MSTSVANTVESYRQRLSTVWCDLTANPQSRPLPEGKPASLGQCEVASAILFDRLSADFAEAKWRLVYGRVLVARGLGRAGLLPIIDEHFWVDYSRVETSNPIVVDVTGDQADHPLLGPVVIQTYDELSERGVMYEPHKFYANTAEFTEAMAQYNSNFDARFRHLREMIGQFE